MPKVKSHNISILFIFILFLSSCGETITTTTTAESARPMSYETLVLLDENTKLENSLKTVGCNYDVKYKTSKINVELDCGRWVTRLGKEKVLPRSIQRQAILSKYYTNARTLYLRGDLPSNKSTEIKLKRNLSKNRLDQVNATIKEHSRYTEPTFSKNNYLNASDALTQAGIKVESKNGYIKFNTAENDSDDMNDLVHALLAFEKLLPASKDYGNNVRVTETKEKQIARTLPGLIEDMIPIYQELVELQKAKLIAEQIQGLLSIAQLLDRDTLEFLNRRHGLNLK